MSIHKGGAKDINTFRKRVNYNSLPDVSDVTYEGLFNEYYFDTLTNIKNDDEKQYSKEEQLLIPTYCFAKCKVPKPLQLARKLSTTTATTKPLMNNNQTGDTSDFDFFNKDEEEFEYYMNVGLNENFDVNKMKRGKLNLMIVLDNSGSMSSGFDYSSSETKMVVANKAVIALLSHLNNDDRLGVLSFNSDFTLIQPMTFVKDINMDQLKKDILAIKPGGGTNMEMAYSAATSCYQQLFENMKKTKQISNDGSTPKDTKSATAATVNEEGGDNDGNDNENKDKKEREKWTTDSLCEIYSESEQKWYQGTIIKIVTDKEGEWLTVGYRTGDEKTPTLKQIGRFAKEIRPIEVGYTPNIDYANRIIFLTDAQPNSRSGGDSLLSMTKRNSSTEQYKGFQIHTTV